jgi:hypothetical protein
MKQKISTVPHAYFNFPVEESQEYIPQSDEVIVTCYENEVPAFVPAEMDRLYENVFSSLKQLRIYSGDDIRINTYIARQGQEIKSIILFLKEGSKVRVMNEVIELNVEQINLFSSYIFNRFGDVSIIRFHAIQAEEGKFSYPVQRYGCSEDIILELPDTEKEYQDKLGKNTRRNLKRYSEKLQRDHPSFEFFIVEKDQVDEQYIRDIVELNKARMAEKNKDSIIDDPETARMIRLVKEYGMVGVAKINGKVCAGSISYWIGSNYYLSVIAHNPDYDPYWIGILTCYYTIQRCIQKGAKKFHFLWGRYDYKFTLLAKLHDLHDVAIYRSWFHCLTNPKTALGMACAKQKRKIQLLLHETKSQHQHDFWTRTLVSFVRTIRGIKHGPFRQ